MLTRADKVLIACIICGAVFLGGYNLLEPLIKKEPTLVEIRIRGEKVAELSLEEDGDYRFYSRENLLLIEISNGQVRMAHSDCPDQICVRHGWISETGGAIICLPNRFVAEICGESLLDGVSK